MLGYNAVFQVVFGSRPHPCTNMVMLDCTKSSWVRLYNTHSSSITTHLCYLLTWPCSCSCLVLDSRPSKFNYTEFTTRPCSHLCLLLKRPKIKENKALTTKNDKRTQIDKRSEKKEKHIREITKESKKNIEGFSLD